jgi:hypothetical protein
MGGGEGGRDEDFGWSPDGFDNDGAPVKFSCLLSIPGK